MIIALSVVFLCTALAQEITKISGVVEIKKQLNAAWRPADLGDVLTADASLRSFEGNVSLRYPNNDLIKLSSHSELSYIDGTLGLIAGKAYLNAWQFKVNKDLSITGEVRLDTNENGWRAAVLSGHADIGGLVKLEVAQQYIIDPSGEATVSTYTEQDPWYRDFSVVGEGQGLVIGSSGIAELSRDGETWAQTELGNVFAPGTSARTGANAWLEVRFDDGNIIRLQAESEISLGALEDLDAGIRQSTLELRYGKVWAIVETQDQPFKIETPGLIAGVRGTKFRVDAANSSSDALVKTFDGTVASIIGFKEALVNEGEQFESLTGVEPLELDALDVQNLTQDRLLQPPSLRINPTSFRTTEPTLSFAGLSDPDTLISFNGQIFSSKSGEANFDLPLKSGFNLIQLSAQAGEGGVRALRAIPVILEARDVFVDARFDPDTGLLKGVAPAGSLVSITGDFSGLDLIADETNRFEVFLPKDVTAINLAAQLDTGEQARKDLILSD